VPFVLSGRRGDRDYLHIDVFGRARRFVDHGRSEAPCARAAADALRAWGVAVGDAVEWIAQPTRDTDLPPIGKAVLARLEAAHRGFDGDHELDAALTPYRDALDRALARHGGFDGSRLDVDHAALVRSLHVLRLRLPDDGGAFAGRLVAELPDPFGPLLDVWTHGYVVFALADRGATLLAPTPPA
jgi:hypothetical protein